MAVTQQIEAAIDQLIAKLTADLPAKVAAVNAEAADAYSIAVPAGISFGARSETPYPWVMVYPEGSDQPTDASGRIHWQHRIRVVTWLDDGDEEALVRRLIRLGRAVRECAMLYRRPGSSYTDPVGGYGLQLVSEEFGPIFDGSSEGVGFVSWVAASFTVQQQQDL